MSEGLRKLTKDEYDIYSGAAASAVKMVPSFRDSIALLRPYVHETADTTSVDPHARVRLWPGFFELEKNHRVTLVLHETMHILSQHFSRTESLGVPLSLKSNIAADCEIGTTLEMLPASNMTNQIVPSRGPEPYSELPKNHTFEQYYGMLPDMPEPPPNSGSSGESGTPSEDGDEEGQESGSSQPGDPKGGASKGCDTFSEDEMAEADAAGIEKASEVEKAVAQSNTEARVNEEAKKSKPGSSPMGSFLGKIQDAMRPPKVNWKKEFRTAVARFAQATIMGSSDYSYERIDRRYTDHEFIIPGMVSYQPTGMLGLDQSGSMGAADNVSALSEAEGIIKATSFGNHFSVFTIDTEVSGGVQKVKSVRDIKLHGGGGTDMAPAWKYVRTLNRFKRPDIFILATDGGVPWEPVIRELRLTAKMFKSIILITDAAGFKGVPIEVKRLATVFDVSSPLKR